MPNDGTIPHEEDPNHLLIWLDAGIGDPERYKHLKQGFSSTADPKNETPIKLVDKDYTAILRAEGPTIVHFEGVWFLLAAFDDVERCIKCFEENQEKRIFFIVSGSLGETAVPRIMARFSHVFTDPVTQDPYASIYVFCHDIGRQVNWALEYRAYIQIFNFDADLLSRLVRDIGDYFLIQSRRLLDEDPPNNPSAKHCLTWAHELYQRYSAMEEVSMKQELDEVNALLAGVDEDMASSSDEDN